MKFRQIVLVDIYDILRNKIHDPEEIGAKHRPQGRPLTERQLDKYNKCWEKEIEDLEERLAQMKVDVTPHELYQS